MSLLASVVIATRNRGASLARLVTELGQQSLRGDVYEIIVVDDGSPEPVAPVLADVPTACPLRVTRIAWSGPGAARHHGAAIASGNVLVFVDDDMHVEPGFLAAHLGHHERTPHAVVLGRIDPAPGLARMPLFERYHARQLERWRRGIASGSTTPRGMNLCTGNVSMRRDDYDAVGGFDASLARSEDRELGMRLEARGCAIVHGDDVVSVHCSDHDDASVWMKRAYLYGRYDQKISVKHPGADAHPWRYWSLIHPLSRPIVALSLLWPWAGHVLAQFTYGLAVVLDRLALSGPALTCTAFVFALEYFRGLREECGSLSGLMADIRRARGVRGFGDVWREFVAAVRADHESVRHYRMKYHGEALSRGRLPLDLLRKVGFQMLFAYRVMRLLDGWRLPLLPMLASRGIRHLYGAEIHWKARIAPGVSIVHGVGLVLSHAAEIGTGCILFQNVTLGESVDAETGAIGAPRLAERVHVGPGATLLGPIEIGEGTKIAAGSVLMRSVSPGSLVSPPQAVVSARSVRAVPLTYARPQHAAAR